MNPKSQALKKTLELTRKQKPTLVFERKPEPKPRKVDIRTIALNKMKQNG